MEAVTDVIVEQMLSSMDNSPVNPSREEKFLAFTVCKNLADLGTSGMAIIKEMQKQKLPVNDLPDIPSIQLCQGIIKNYYSDSMFIEDEEFGNVPEWKVISRFDSKRTEIAYRIYRSIRLNLVGNDRSTSLRKAIREKNKAYFIQNFDDIFADIPFKDGLIVFKNFIQSPHVSQKNQDVVWDFFDSFVELYENEKYNLEDLKGM